MNTRNHSLPLPREDSAIDRAFRQVLWRMGCFALLLHLGYLFLFRFYGSSSMGAFNIGSVVLYMALLAMLQMRCDLKVVLGLAVLEIVVHAALAVRFVGWDSGFNYFLLLLILVVFVGPLQAKAKLGLGAFIAGSFLMLDWVVEGWLPLEPLPPHALKWLRTGNIASAFIFVAQMGMTYFEAVRTAEDRLRRHAATDPLTGLMNRRSMLTSIKELTGRPSVGDARGPLLSMLLIDIDHFKSINDRLGHQAGDEALRGLAVVLRSQVRREDRVARWGGEEFLVVLPGADLAESRRVAERIRTGMQSKEACREGEERLTTFTATIGMSSLQPGESLEACLMRADQALYRGKQAGRNCIVDETSLAALSDPENRPALGPDSTRGETVSGSKFA